MCAESQFIVDCKSRILEDIDKSAFDEVASCYEHGFFKAGYILCWTVLAESLRHKIKRLADLGYKPGEAEHKRIEALERSHRSADVQIIESAKTCELISDSELTICRQLWTKRCLFAHPYGTKATDIDCQDIIEKTISYSMGRSLYLTKEMIEERLEDYINHPHTIPAKNRADEIVDSFLKLILPKNHATLFLALFYRIRLRHEADDSGEIFQFLLHICRRHIRTNNIDLNEAKYKLDKGIAQYPLTVWYIVCFKEIWETISDDRRKALVKYLKSTSVPFLLLVAISSLIKNNATDIDGLYQEYYARLGKLSLSSGFDLYIDKDKWLDHVWGRYISECQFDKQADFVEFLDKYPDTIRRFSDAQIRCLGEFVGFCCCTNTFKAQNFVGSHSSAWFKDPHFLQGIIEESLKSSDRKKLIFSAWRYGLIALKLLKRVSPANAANALNDIMKTPIDTDDFKYRYNRKELENTLSSVLAGDEYKGECEALLGLIAPQT